MTKTEDSGLYEGFSKFVAIDSKLFLGGLIVCLALALRHATFKIRLGGADSKPEFSGFSWFSTMFGAGIGIVMPTYATGETI